MNRVNPNATFFIFHSHIRFFKQMCRPENNPSADFCPPYVFLRIWLPAAALLLLPEDPSARFLYTFGPTESSRLPAPFATALCSS